MFFNTDWFYCPDDKPAFSNKTCLEKPFTDVSIPHTNVELRQNSFSDAEYQFVSWSLDFDGVPRQLILKIDNTELVADGSDMTQLPFFVVGKYGKVLPFVTGAV